MSKATLQNLSDTGSVNAWEWRNPFFIYPDMTVPYEEKPIYTSTYILNPGCCIEDPKYFLNEVENEKTFDYRFCMTGISKENLALKIKDKKILIYNKEKLELSTPLCHKCSKIKIKEVKASLCNGILIVSITKEKEEEISIKVE